VWRRPLTNSPPIRAALGSVRDNAGKSGAESTSTSNLPSGALADLPQRGSRPISTVIDPTRTREADGETKILTPGHVQFQPSAEDLRLNPRLAPALGHSPQFVAGQRPDSFLVQGELSDGRKFKVMGVRAEAKLAGEDKPLPIGPSTLVIDHGTMTPEQSRLYETMQARTVFPRYETSGLEGSNCVHAHAENVRQLLDHDVGPLPAHLMPQEMQPLLKDVKTEPER
jgi:hypothetical protein